NSKGAIRASGGVMRRIGGCSDLTGRGSGYGAHTPRRGKRSGSRKDHGKPLGQPGLHYPAARDGGTQGQLSRGVAVKDHNTILVVDDDSYSLRLLTDTLTGGGYRVRPADSGELALASVDAIAPGLILLDIRMPGMDGFEVCRRLKADPKSR